MQLTRRFFLRSSGALLGYLGLAPAAALGTVAGPVRRGRTLVVLFLRGGADGLNLVVPHGDEHYYRHRRGLALGRPGSDERDAVIDLDGRFGLHPRLAPLEAHFDANLAVAAHAVGYAHNTRSHFEEQDVWETGVIGNTINSDGWLNRHLATSTGHGRIRAVAVGDTLPRIMHGRSAAYAIRGLEDLTLGNIDGVSHERLQAAFEHASGRAPNRSDASDARDLVARTANATLEGMAELRDVAGKPYRPRAAYPESDLGRRLMQVARLIKADVGLEVAEVELDGWDTHRNQGDGARGAFGNLAGTLAAAVDAFVRDLGDRMDDVLLVTLTDFGRTAAENGTRGTDHGWSNAMFLLGGSVARARQPDRPVVTDWPGLAPDQLHEGRDLLHTTDFRDVLAEIVRVHLGNPNLASVLPDQEFRPVGLVG